MKTKEIETRFQLSILSVLTILTLLCCALAHADESNVELELVGIANQQMVKPMIERICKQVPYLETGLTIQECTTIVGVK